MPVVGNTADTPNSPGLLPFGNNPGEFGLLPFGNNPGEFGVSAVLPTTGTLTLI